MLKRASKEVIYILDENPNKLTLVPWMRKASHVNKIAKWMKIWRTWSQSFEEGIQGNCSMDENPRNLVTFHPRKLRWKFEEIGSTSPEGHARKLNLMNEKSKEVGPISWEKWDNGWAWRCFNFFGESGVVDEMKPHHPTSWASIYPISCVGERFQTFSFSVFTYHVLTFQKWKRVLQCSIGCAVCIYLWTLLPLKFRGQK
jgi:hypothetical protein